MAYRIEYSFMEEIMNLPNKITTFRMVMVIVLILLLTICGGLNFTGPYLWGDEETGVSLIRFITFVLSPEKLKSNSFPVTLG